MPPKGEKKKKKKRLTNEQILKLIKKLKPKNQQNVRIHIGDKGKEKATTGYQPQPGSVIFTHTNAPIVSPPPAVPSAPLPPTPPVPMQPKKEIPIFVAPKKRSPQRLTLTSTEEPFKESRLAEKISKQFGKYESGRKLLEEEEYTYSKPTTFKAPSYAKPSDLATKAQYEIYSSQPIIIPYVEDFDQSGVRSSFNMSSDTWTLTPEGPAEPLEQPTTIAEEMLKQEEEQSQPQELTREEQIQQGIIFPPIPEEEKVPLKTKQIPTPASSAQPLKKMQKSAEGRIVGPASMVAEINTAIREGFDITPFSINPSNTYQKGKNVGQIRSNLTTAKLNELYEAVKASY